MLVQLLAGAVVAANFASASEAYGDGVLHVPLTKPGVSKRLERRDAHDSVLERLMNKRVVYAASLEIGSNSQNVSALLDTTSGDLVVISSASPNCSSISHDDPYEDYLEIGGLPPDSDNVTCYKSSVFDSSASSTFSKNDTEFAIEYVGHFQSAKGTYGQDDVKFGGLTIKKANFVVANETSTGTSVWGIGFPGSGEYIDDDEPSKLATYSNLPMQLKEQGHIKSVAYSLWLDDKNKTTGSLLFGGVDHSKYNGTLQTVPLLSGKPGDKPSDFRIKLDGVTMYQGDRKLKLANISYPAVLFSTEPYMRLPDDLVNAIQYSLAFSCDTNACYTSCGYEGGLTFDFSGVEINVPFSEFLESGWDLPGSETDCLIPWASRYGGDNIILGENFLRSAYVVYDLEHCEIALAQRDFNGGSGSVEAISASIPGAVKAPRYSDTSLALTGTYTSSDFLVYPEDASSSTEAATTASASSTNAAKSSGPAASRTTESSKQGTTASAAASPSTADSSSTSSSVSSASSSASSASSSASSSSSASASSTSSKAESNAAVQGGALSLLNSLYAGVMGLLFYI